MTLIMFIQKMITIIKNLMNTITGVKKKAGYYNTHYRQKMWTKIAVDQFKSGETYSWGISIENENRLGDYMRLKDELLLPNIIGKTVVEIGCLDGKWSQYIVPCAEHSFLVDLSKDILPVLNDRLHEVEGGGYTFYKTKGFELDGIDNNTIDFIFSMDTLVRVNKKYLSRYFEHFRRVLKSNGKMLIHLPCISSPFSKSKGFVKLHPDKITEMMINNGFNEFTFDFSIINHGVLLKYGF